MVLVSRTINTWVLVHQGIHDLPRSKRQNSYNLQQMKQGKKLNKKTSLLPMQNGKLLCSKNNWPGKK